MAHENTLYTIILVADLTQAHIDDSKETSLSTVRKSLDGLRCILKFDSVSVPSIYSSETQYTHAQLSAIINGTENLQWNDPTL